MVVLLVDGWAHPNAASAARASQMEVRIVGWVMERKARRAHVFDRVMIRDVYHHGP
jgi:hypothetical protein